MAEKPRILGQGFKRVYGCPFCAEQGKGSCACDRFCGSILCSWKVEGGRPTVGPERPPRVQRGEADIRGVAGSAQAPGARQASGPETPPPNLMLNIPAQDTVAQTSPAGMLKMDVPHGSSVAVAGVEKVTEGLKYEPGRDAKTGLEGFSTQRPSVALNLDLTSKGPDRFPNAPVSPRPNNNSFSKHRTPNEIMAEYRANRPGYQEFPPGVKLGPGVWDRKGPPPAERDLKPPVADLPPGKRGPERKTKQETDSLSAWT